MLAVNPRVAADLMSGLDNFLLDSTAESGRTALVYEAIA
jgi:hypothetical protein